MEVKQIYELTNTVATEVLGESAIVAEDLSNLVDIGKQVFDANAFDAYVKSLINHIGKVKFVNRAYKGSAPSVMMDSWEYGSILEKIASDMPVAVENPSWDLVDGQSYDPNVFHQPTAAVKFFNKRTTFEIERSVTERALKQSFSSATQLNGFLSMLANETEKALTIRNEALIERTINNMIGETVLADFSSGTGMGASSGVRAVNLLYLYNQQFPNDTITAAQAIYHAPFLKFAAYKMGLYTDRFTKMSTLFNAGGKARFTDRSMQKAVLLSEFAQGADVYLQSDTFHNEYTTLIKADRVPYWQGSGTDYGFSSTSKVYVTPASQESAQSPKTIQLTGVLGILFDHDALGVTNYDHRVTTQYNPKAEFTNYFYKRDAGYFNDTNENFVVFYVMDAS